MKSYHETSQANGYGTDNSAIMTLQLIIGAVMLVLYAFLSEKAWAEDISAPSSLTAKSISPTQIVLGWMDNSTNETGFRIERRTGGCNSTNPWIQVATKVANATSHTVSGLSPNTTYAFRIRAYQSFENSTYSNCASAKTGLSGTPRSPSNLKAISESATQVSLTWKDNSTNETGFKIYRKTGAGTWTLLATTAAGTNSFDDAAASGNNSATVYQYYVRACNASGDSAATYTAVIPYQPINLTATPDNASGTVKLTWTDKSSNETGFEIYRKSGSCSSSSTWTQVAVLGANQTEWTETGHSAGDSFSYKIRAYKKSSSILSAYGYSNYSDCILATFENEELPGTTTITLQGDSITVKGSGAKAAGSTVTITSAGAYSISGTLNNGQIIVNTKDQEDVVLILNGINIHNSSSSPVYIMSAENVAVTLADNSENHLEDGTSYVYPSATEDEPDAAFFSKSDLTISGKGSLSIDANYKDGIKSKDRIKIEGGFITITSNDDGIVGKDYIEIKDGTITVNAGGDGLKSTEDEDAEKGYINIEDGILHITSGADAIQAETDVSITGGEFVLVSGGGSSAVLSASASAKGIKAGVDITIDNGDFEIDSADDALNSNNKIGIHGGVFSISTGDDGMHADAALTINSGEIDIIKSYEGLESTTTTINGGEIHINSSDDGLNGGGGVDGTGTNLPAGFNPGTTTGGPGVDGFESGDGYLYIHGGYLAVNAYGDGIDINGGIEMTGGTVLVNGPVDNFNGPLDYMSSFKITGGFLVAAGSSGMAQAPSQTSTQYSVLVNFRSQQQAGTLVNIQTASGSSVMTFKPEKRYQSLVLSSPDLKKGSAYNVYLGGSSTGAVADSLYQNGTYTPGSKYTSFTISTITTSIR